MPGAAFLPRRHQATIARNAAEPPPNVHPVCHLDDARRRNGLHVDTTGGWHDAGDLRKWMSATMMNAFGLLAFGPPSRSRLGWLAPGSRLEEELRWGNRYFLKMQNPDGLVWADVAGGVNGDNSDNHWTDNAIGTADDAISIHRFRD